MKKFITSVNVQAVVLFLISVAQTVIMALFKPIDVWIIVLLQMASLAAIAIIRFAPKIAYLRNFLHSRFYRINADDGVDDEPSGLAIFLVKLTGYLMFALQTIFMFL